MAVQDTQFVTGGFQDNFFSLAGQYLNFRSAEKQAEASGQAQKANFHTTDVSSRPGAEPASPTSEKAAASQNQQKQLMLVGAGVVGAVVLFAVLKK